MIYEKIVPAGTPLLKTRSKEVPLEKISSFEIQNFIDDLIETMKHHKGAGLCAPQIGKNWRIFSYGFDKNPRYPNAGSVPLAVWINPIVEQYSSEIELGFEGCLSIGTLRGEVPRHHSIRVRGYNREGTEIIKQLRGFEARIFQHEIDHLDGIFFIERIQNFDSFGFTEVLKKHSIIS